MRLWWLLQTVVLSQLDNLRRELIAITHGCLGQVMFAKVCMQTAALARLTLGPAVQASQNLCPAS